MRADLKRIKESLDRENFSLRQYLLSELRKARTRIYGTLETPHPYCELDCSWLLICRRTLPPACILRDLQDSTEWTAYPQGEIP